MALSDYQPDRTEVMYRDKVLVRVRGLNMEDVGTLMRHHLQDIQTVYKIYSDSGGTPSDMDIQALMFNLLTAAPQTAAKMIAMACEPEDGVGMDEMVAAARRLSAPLQLKILIEITRLTAEDVGGPLALRAMLSEMTKSISTALPNPTSASTMTI